MTKNFKKVKRYFKTLPHGQCLCLNISKNCWESASYQTRLCHRVFSMLSVKLQYLRNISILQQSCTWPSVCHSQQQLVKSLTKAHTLCYLIFFALDIVLHCCLLEQMPTVISFNFAGMKFRVIAEKDFFARTKIRPIPVV